MEATKNKLEGSLFYLSGSMEFSSDRGVSWRRYVTAELKKINIKCIDPTNKPHSEDSDYREDVNVIQKLKNEGKYKELAKYMNDLRRCDLRFVDLSDCLLIHLDTSVHTCGSYHELFETERQHKPRLVVIRGGWKKLPTWCCPIFKESEIFEDFDSCIDYIKKLDNGTIPLDDKWVLVRKALKYEGEQ